YRWGGFPGGVDVPGMGGVAGPRVRLGRISRMFKRIAVYAILLASMLFLLQASTVPLGLPWNAVSAIASPYQFDYVQWELDALAIKVDQTLYGLHPFMDEVDRVQFVRDYMAELGRAQGIEAQIAGIYADPQVSDPGGSTEFFRADRDRLRADLKQKQALAEAILEGQVAAALAEQGFGLLGQVIPPVSAHFTPVPNLLVVSPRDQIRFDVSINLNPMTIDDISDLEARIDESQAVSSLVVPLGGIALYPAMVLETSYIPYALDTIAHEWLHHYLFAFPLGLQYFNGESFAGEARIINETTASIFGHEVSRLVLARYYPDLLPPEPVPVATDEQPQPTSEPPAFDFGREMDITRRRVDNLLAAGKVDDAEQYMEARRRHFAANGYSIRKLNQAYFAFYGGYQAGDTLGAAGADPIGEAVQAIRDASPSLHEWVVTMRGITRRDDLLAAANQLRRSQ
ncbi:MAG: hypothetical protein K8I30_09070, partial [Anaerolineae bacterium]|nr:hypothetical protein [Anaerolineae bacterium]